MKCQQCPSALKHCMHQYKSQPLPLPKYNTTHSATPAMINTKQMSTGKRSITVASSRVGGIYSRTYFLAYLSHIVLIYRFLYID